MVSTTRDGPALHLPVPISESLAVGKVMVGLTPQISLPELAGERNTVGLMSPSPNALRIPGAGEGWLIMGVVDHAPPRAPDAGARVDAGGFGVDSDMAVQAYAELGCHITRNIYSEGRLSISL